MLLSDSVKPISYVKAHAAEIIRRITQDGQPVVVTLNGQAKVIIEDIRDYERQQETLALLKLLALGRKEVLAGQIKPMAEAFTVIDARIATGRKTRSKCKTAS